ncbi:hypothetical protein CSA37_08485 [Candidatus Fermentibacteria bacterium]|nr:MAG: hypothetical protein CSA37_08485 [Candidatus Fermentibacteria bacterium]
MGKILSIADSDRTGFYNMAADVCAMELVRSMEYDVVFRTYTWKPHCLSLGKFQNPDREVDLNRLLEDGYHMVRRPTGGRAVWHGDELTYSIAARQDHHLVSGTIQESLFKVAKILIAALERAGIPAVMNRRERELAAAGREHNPCFTSHGRSEIITPDGRKLVGSAQARSSGVFLEHGSILFTNQQPMAAEYLPEGAPRETMKRLLARGAGTVREYNTSVTKDELAMLLKEEFEKRVSNEADIIEGHDVAEGHQKKA